MKKYFKHNFRIMTQPVKPNSKAMLSQLKIPFTTEINYIKEPYALIVGSSAPFYRSFMFRFIRTFRFTFFFLALLEQRNLFNLASKVRGIFEALRFESIFHIKK